MTFQCLGQVRLKLAHSVWEATDAVLGRMSSDQWYELCQFAGNVQAGRADT